MNSSVIVTVVGPDRPGIVGGLAATVAEHGGNWLESRMARLAGHFAGILRVEAPAARCAALREALRKLEATGLAVVVEETAASPVGGEYYGLQLELVGHDRPGIVAQITGVIRRHGINIEELDTSTERAPQTDDLLFRARAVLQVPRAVAQAALRRDLEAIAGELMVDLALTEPHVR